MEAHMIIIKPLYTHIEATCDVYAISIRDAFEKEGLGHLETEITSEIAYKRELLTAFVAGGETDRLILIALEDEKVIGTISYGPCGKEICTCTDVDFPAEGELGGLYVLPSAQGRGIGSKLIHAMIGEMHLMGVKQFALDSGYTRAQKRWIHKFGAPYLVANDFWGPDLHHMIWLCQVADFL